MKRSILPLVCICFASFGMFGQESQDKLPYYEIPEYPESYTPGSVAARMIDGLGFRYYWATEGLREEDLAFKPNEEARTSAETIDHIYGLSKTIINSALHKPNVRDGSEEVMTFAEKRKKTLENFKTAADILRTATDLSGYTIVFQNGDQRNEYPFWNHINGPIADAIWHCGQVVSFRRSSGNPFNSKVSVFSGTVRQ